MEELRGRQLADQLRSLADLNRLTGSFEKFATAAVYFPKLLDDALTQLSTNDDARAGSQNADSDGRQFGLLASLAIAVMLVLMFSGQFHGISSFSERMMLILLMFAGLLILRNNG